MLEKALHMMEVKKWTVAVSFVSDFGESAYAYVNLHPPVIPIFLH